MDLRSTVKLNNGVQMPWVGLGVFLSREGRETESAVRWALELGYRHIDTAAAYNNERDVGKALKSSGLARDQVFVTTKVWNADQGFESTLKAFDSSRRRLELDTLDLYLVHWPVKGKYQDTWRALEKLYSQGKVRAIGVSNFLVHHLQDLLAKAAVVPAVNQVEFHPFLLQRELLEFGRAKGIRQEAWSPLTRAKLLTHPLITELASKHGRSNPQVLLRWDLQHEVVTIPKSVHRERIEENSRIFDFELPPQDMARLDALDNGTRIGPDPDNFNF
jgi:diketogulonate reductase-like aldo/keto reductase